MFTWAQWAVVPSEDKSVGGGVICHLYLYGGVVGSYVICACMVRCRLFICMFTSVDVRVYTYTLPSKKLLSSQCASLVYFVGTHFGRII
jgi:hypothetical protein